MTFTRMPDVAGSVTGIKGGLDRETASDARVVGRNRVADAGGKGEVEEVEEIKQMTKG